MVAGFGAYFSQEFNIPSQIGGLILCCICILILKNKTNGIIGINEIVIPIMIVLIILLAILSSKNFNYTEHIKDNHFIKSVINAMIYTSYNSIVLIPIVIDLKKLAGSKKKAFAVSMLCCTILAVLGYIIFDAITRFRGNRKN